METQGKIDQETTKLEAQLEKEKETQERKSLEEHSNYMEEQLKSLQDHHEQSVIDLNNENSNERQQN